MREVGVHLGTGGIAHDERVVGDAQVVVGLDAAFVKLHADRLEPQPVERRGPADGQQRPRGRARASRRRGPSGAARRFPSPA